MKSYLTLLALVVLVSSCAIHSGTISTNAVNGNVQYKDIAYGVSRTSKFLGIGGLSKDAMVLEAKKDLMKNNPLKPGEQYINFTVDTKRSLFFVVFTTKLTLTADIVKVSPDKIDEVFTEMYLSKLSSQTEKDQLFEVGDTVIYTDRNKEGIIISTKRNDDVRILILGNSEKDRSIVKSKSNIYAKHKTYNGLSTGEFYAHVIQKNGSDEKAVVGKILALGTKKFLVLDDDGEIRDLNYR